MSKLSTKVDTFFPRRVTREQLDSSSARARAHAFFASSIYPRRVSILNKSPREEEG